MRRTSLPNEIMPALPGVICIRLEGREPTVRVTPEDGESVREARSGRETCHHPSQATTADPGATIGLTLGGDPEDA